MTKPPDPWSEITPKGAGGDVSARRVDPEHPYHFFWARDSDGRAVLVLRYAPENACAADLPSLQGIEIVERPHVPGEQGAMIITLKKSDDREIFHRLCVDLVENARVCSSEREAVQAAVARTWKWHALLTNEADQRLSIEAQQGLVGELLFLEMLLDRADPAAALGYWRGPVGAPKDFLVNGSAAELKSRQGGRPYVKISSEHQLDRDGLRALFLAVVELTPASEQVDGAFTLDGLVTRLRSVVDQASPARTAQLNGLLATAGFLDEHDYSDRWWLQIGLRVFEVGEGFPSVVPTMLPSGVTETRYHLDLGACVSFATDEERLFSAFFGAS